MREFKYTITDPLGVHAHPARLLVGVIKGLGSDITITKENGSCAENPNLAELMALEIKLGDKIYVTVDGGPEEANCSALAKFVSDIL